MLKSIFHPGLVSWNNYILFNIEVANIQFLKLDAVFHKIKTSSFQRKTFDTSHFIFQFSIEG